MAGVGDLLAKEPLSHSGAQSVFPLNPWISTGYGSCKYVLNRTSGFRGTGDAAEHLKSQRDCRESFKCSPSFFTCCSPYYSAPLAHGRDYKADKVIHTTIPAYSETCQSPVMKCRDVDLSMKCAQSVRYIYARCKSYQHIHYSNTY